jgi:hypothetical protein
MVRATAMAVIGIVLGVTAAHGASISNRDERDYTVTIITLSDVCLKGCTIRVNGKEDDEYRLTGGDVVSIEDGTVFYDAPETPEDSGALTAKGKARSRTKG